MPNDNDNNNENARRVAFRITGVFEAPSYSTIQTVDSGIISYGQHQATLTSGTLETIIRKYCDTCDSDVAKGLANFLTQVAAKSVALKSNQTFLQLLRDAGKEQAMIDAQDSVFVEKYWNPAVARATAEGVGSPLGFSIFYDTNVQGGLDSSIQRTRAKLGNSSPGEQKYLKTFLESRRERLLEIAAKQINSGNSVKIKNGKMLQSAAKNRIGSLMKLVDANNLDLTGSFDINGTMVKGNDGSSPASTPTTTTTPTTTPTTTSPPTPKDLQRGDVSDDVKRLQESFVKLGYMQMDKIGGGFGKFGPMTQTAVETFQKDLGLTVNGKFGEAERAFLKAIESGIGKGSPNTQIVKAIQNQLVKHGFMTQAQVDTGFGTFGNKTDNAVKTFQGKADLPQNGVVEAATYKLLFTQPVTTKTTTGDIEFFKAENGENYNVASDILISKSLEAKVKKLADIYFAKRNAKITVTSGYRGPDRQAAAMYDKIKNGNEAAVRNLYKNKTAVDQILNAYRAHKNNEDDAIKAMTETLVNQVKNGVFISRHLLSNAIDLRKNVNRDALSDSLKAVGGGKILDEGNHIHIEFS